jgi:hypothetical protein
MFLNSTQKHRAAEIAWERKLRCPSCGSLGLEAGQADWVLGEPGKGLWILMWCTDPTHTDPTHNKYVPLKLSKEEASQHLGLKPRTD